MKQIFLGMFFLFFFEVAICQSVKSYEFIGTLQLQAGEIITYKINFKCLPDNRIEGFSLTDIYGEDRTKSAIRGTYDSITNKISFTETVNISTKSTAGESEFCYIKVSNIKVKSVKGKSIIQGGFTGTFKDGKVCASGQLYLVSSEFLYKLADDYVNSKKVRDKDSSGALLNKYNELKDKTSNDVLEGSEKLTVNWSAKDLVLEIWDGKTEDKDEVEVYLNNKRIIDRITIKQLKKTFVIPFEGETGEIRIVGVSEGLAPPCTLNLLLRDGENSTSLVAKLKKGESAYIVLKR